MAPFFGASTIVWANTIGVVLVALSAGYWFGGRLADRHPTCAVSAGVVLVAAVLLAIVPFVSQPFLDVSADALDSISAGAFFGSLIGVSSWSRSRSSCSAWSRPGRCAWRSPTSRTRAGRGRLYAISTAGSLLGTMLSALVLIPLPARSGRSSPSRWRCGRRGDRARPALRRWRPSCSPARSRCRSGRQGDGRREGHLRGRDRTAVRPRRRGPDGKRLLELNEGHAVHSLYRPGRT